MDWKELVASLVSSVAWALAVAVLIFVLREPLRAALKRPLKSLTIGPLGAEWNDAAETVVVNAASSGAQAIAPSYESELERLKVLASQAPVPAVRDGFSLVERELWRIAKAVSVEPTGQGAVPLARELRSAGAITQETVAAVQGLATLRNLAAHDDGSGLAVTPERAREYIPLIEATLFALSRANVPSVPAVTS